MSMWWKKMAVAFQRKPKTKVKQKITARTKQKKKSLNSEN